MSLALALPLAFAAGLLTILSPCILPLAPIVVATARAEDPRGPLALAAGLALAFAAVGTALAAVGVEVGSLSGIRLVAAALMVAAGAVLLLPKAADRLEVALAGLGGASAGAGALAPRTGLLGQAAAGAVLALAWAPCAGPTLGAAFALAANRGTLAAAALVMFVYALGAAGAMLAVGFGLGRMTRAARAGALLAGRGGRAALGLSLVAFGALVITGLDHQVEAALVGAMPNWLANAAASL